MNSVQLAYNILRYLGPRFIWLRAGVFLKKSLGSTRRVFRSRSWDQWDLSEIVGPGVPTAPGPYAAFKRQQATNFLFPLGHPPPIPDAIRKSDQTRRPSLEDRVELLRQNRCVYFFRTPSPHAVDWYKNPFQNYHSDPHIHFSDLPDFLPQQGDARTLWEPSRAAWAIDCAKASATKEFTDIDKIYWHWVDSWMDACPPYQGIHWKCGQESAVRLIAILLGFWAVAKTSSMADARYRQIARLTWATGFRIYHHIHYAISQKNNHAISEAVGLMVASHLFPEFREAPIWERRGRSVLENEIRRQVYKDGSYIQHSFNYQRVMMQGAILGLRIAELAGKPLDRSVYQSLERCSDFMFEMLDSHTGQTPMYGNNDGAHILPFSECDFLDFRPVVQAAHYAVHRERRLPDGPWNEDLIWLYGNEPITSENKPVKPPTGKAFEDGNYYTLRQTNSWCMLRCHSYRDRPGHYDQLHLDLWWQGINLFRDCGTFQYYIPEREDLEYYFKSIRSHNTVEIGDQNPLELTSRFLWFPWPRGMARRYISQPGNNQNGTRGTLLLEAEHYDYGRAPWHSLHRRSVIGLPGDCWVIVDDLMGAPRGKAVLRWHMPDLPWRQDEAQRRLVLSTQVGEIGIFVALFPEREFDMSVKSGSDAKGQVQGLASSYYGEYKPILTLEATLGMQNQQRIVTTVGPQLTATTKLEEPELSEQKTENWLVESPDHSFCISLAPAERNARQVYLSHTIVGPGVTTA